MIKVFCGFISTGDRSSAQVHTMRFIEERYKDTIKLVYPEVEVYRFGHDFARNETVKEFLNSDCDVLWFLDSDVCPPEGILDVISLHWDKWELAGAPYPVWMKPAGEASFQAVFTVYNRNETGGMAAASIPSDGIGFVDGIATGCLFIKRDVFSKLEKPYFKFIRNEETMNVERGEDIDFCMRVSDLGYKFFIDYSMVCKHFKTVDLLEVNNYAIEYSNKSIIAYDQQVRSDLARMQLATKFRRKGVSPAQPLSQGSEKTVLDSGNSSTNQGVSLIS